MDLREILENLVNSGNPKLFDINKKETNAVELLEKLPSVRLKRKAHLQPGMYIAEINDSGYLGSIIFRFN